MKKIVTTSQFIRDIKRLKKRTKHLAKLQAIISVLANDQTLEPTHRDHKLQGKLKDCRECHIEPDWLLIYQNQTEKLSLVRTGTHADLF